MTKILIYSEYIFWTSVKISNYKPPYFSLKKIRKGICPFAVVGETPPPP